MDFASIVAFAKLAAVTAAEITNHLSARICHDHQVASAAYYERRLAHR